MKRLSLAALSAGFGLALLAAPLAMAQQYAAHHDNGAPHGAPAHRAPAPVHRMVVTSHRQPAPRDRVQPHMASMQHHTMMPPHHAAMQPHDSMQHHS